MTTVLHINILLIALLFVRGIHLSLVDCPHKGPVMWDFDVFFTYCKPEQTFEKNVKLWEIWDTILIGVTMTLCLWYWLENQVRVDSTSCLQLIAVTLYQSTVTRIHGNGWRTIYVAEKLNSAHPHTALQQLSTSIYILIIIIMLGVKEYNFTASVHGYITSFTVYNRGEICHQYTLLLC